MRKHLSGRGKWWRNPNRGGNRNGDFAQVYEESQAGSFKQLSMLMMGTNGDLVKRAVQNWRAALDAGTLDKLAELRAEKPQGDFPGEKRKGPLPQKKQKLTKGGGKKGQKHQKHQHQLDADAHAHAEAKAEGETPDSDLAAWVPMEPGRKAGVSPLWIPPDSPSESGLCMITLV